VFRLVVAAGSARELEEERGYAHFTEHMAFNGTAAYPGNTLDDLLGSLDGGLDLELNAFTYPDCTVYHLELPAALPPDRGDALALGFGILRQWASELSLEPGEVEREKGVIRAELREYDTPEDRSAAREEEALYGGTPLADRGILGIPESVQAASAESLRAFYLREYLPGRMAVIAAGPFEAPEARRALTEAFADLEGRSRPVRAPALLKSDPRPGVRVIRDRDARRTRTELSLAFREPARALRTRADWAVEYRARLSERILAGRLADLGADPSVPWIYLGSERREDRFGERLWRVSVSCPPGSEPEALRSLGRELGALRASGGDPEEADTATLEAGLTLPYPDPDAYEAVESAIRQFLYGDASLDPGRADDLEARLRGAALAGDAPAPGVSRGDLPDLEAGILSVVRPGTGDPGDGDLASAYLEGLGEGRSVGTALRRGSGRGTEPAASGVLSGTGSSASSGEGGGAGIPRARASTRVVLPDGTVDLVLANGIRVRMRATGSGEGWAYLGAWSPGGLAAVPAARRAAADEVPAILARAGYPGHSTADLRAALAGTWAAWRADTAFREETVEVDGGSGDLDLLFRLLAASFRPPAPDPGALRKAAAARAEELRLEAGPEAEFRAVVESSDPARADPAELETWTAEAIRAAWEDRFGNPGDFEFLAVGDFDLAEAERSARKHLGALPAAGIREPVPPPPPAPAPGLRGIDSGNHPRGRILVLWPLRGLSDSDALRLEPLARALETRLFRRIREDLADTYDVYCVWEEWPDQPGSGEFRIELEAAPGRARALAEEVLREVAAFGAGGAGSDDAPSGFSRAADDDEAVYRKLLDGLIAERAAGGAGGRGTPRRIPRNADETLEGSSPDRPKAPAARLLVPDRAAVFVLGWD